MGINDYIIKRILILVPTLFILTMITFTIMHLAPGGPLDFFLAELPFVERDPAQTQILIERMGLDKPIWEQYFIWLRNSLTGNLGWSFHSGKSVSKLILDKLSNTALLMFLALIVSLSIAIPFGVISAVKQYSKIDNVMTLFCLFGTSMPGFWFALMLIFTFALRLNWFPTSGRSTLGFNSTSWLHIAVDKGSHMVLPLIALSLRRLAGTTRMVRSTMLDVLKQDYIITARAKGLKESVVIYKHALKNSLLPVITVVGISIGFLFAGSATIETIFAWPGLGKFMVDNIYKRDYPVIMAATTLIAFMVVIANLLTDIVYAYLDPRIRY